MALLIRSGNFQ